MVTKEPLIIYLEPGDDVVTVRDRLSFLRDERVILVLPSDVPIVRRTLDLILIQRAAQQQYNQLAIVTDSPEVISMAEDVEISVFTSVQDATRRRWQRPLNRFFTINEMRPSDAYESYELSDVASRVLNPRPRGNRLLGAVVRLTIVVAALTVLAGGFYIFVPQAVISIPLPQSRLTAQTLIIADPAVTVPDYNNHIVPATVVRVNVQIQSQIPTTGTSAVQSQSAIGAVTLTNQTSQPVTVPEGTVVSTSVGDPVRFETISSARLSAGQSVEVDIRALDDDSGARGNVEAGTINAIESRYQDTVSVINLSATTGGASARFDLVSEDDRDQLLSIVRGQLQAMADEEMQKSLASNQVVIIETIRIAEERSDWTVFSHSIGDVSDTLTLSMRAVVEAVAIEDAYAQQILINDISSQIPASFELVPNSFSFTRGDVNAINDDDQVTYTASGEALVSATIDARRIADDVTGASLADARQYLLDNFPVVNGVPPRLVLQPDWLPSQVFTQMPVLPFRVQIRTQVMPNDR